MLLNFVPKDKIVKIWHDEIIECDVKMESAMVKYETKPSSEDIVKSFCTVRLNKNNDGNYYQLSIRNLYDYLVDNSPRSMRLVNWDELRKREDSYMLNMVIYYPQKQCLYEFCDVISEESILGINVNGYPVKSLVNLKFSIKKKQMGY